MFDDAELAKAVSTIQTVKPPFIPADAEVMTIEIEWPAGHAGAPPHRHPGGPSFGYVVEGEMLFELEGEAPRVVKAGAPMLVFVDEDELEQRKDRRVPQR